MYRANAAKRLVNCARWIAAGVVRFDVALDLCMRVEHADQGDSAHRVH